MFKNYLMIAVRNLLRYKAYSMVNVLGLAVGMMCCVFTFLFVQHEYSYDRHHRQADRIYKVLREKRKPDGERYYSTGTLGPVAPTLAKEYPAIERGTRFFNRPMQLVYQQKGFTEQVIVADQEFLNVFDYPLLKGNKADLKVPYSAFITQRLAHKMFGDLDPMGKVVGITYKWVKGDFRIVGILKDIPETSIEELKGDLLTITRTKPSVPRDFPENWQEMLWEQWGTKSNFHPMQTYVLLKSGASVSDLTPILPDFALRHLGEKNGIGYALAPLTRLYLYGREDYGLGVYGDYRKSYVFGVVGVFILVIACINFVNLSTARSARRAREVGMRKVVGAHRIHLVCQFMGESVLLSVLALLFALVLVGTLLPYFNAYLGLGLSIDGSVLLGMWGLVLVVGVFAGSYPAFLLSSFRPAVVFKNISHYKGGMMRKGLVVFQFVISIVLIVGTLVVYQQTEFMQRADLGFNREALLIMPLIEKDRRLRGRKHIAAIKHRIRQHAGVLGVATSLFPPGLENDTDMSQVRAEGLNEPVDVHTMSVDHDFLDVYGIPLVEGRNFAPEDLVTFPMRSTQFKVLINETAARALGNIGAGDHVQLWKMSVEVIGIFKDFHNRSLHHAVRPLLVNYIPELDYVTVQIDTRNLPEAMAHLEVVWKAYLPRLDFEYQFMDAYLDGFYRAEYKLQQLYGVCAVLAIFIACLGLLGLVSYTAEVRTKEIAIRKVLGASVTEIASLLVREFLLLAGMANVLAWPLSWFILDRWLQNFAYRIDLEIGVFVLGGLMMVFLALFTVGYQARKAAQTNPVTALQCE